MLSTEVATIGLDYFFIFFKRMSLFIKGKMMLQVLKDVSPKLTSGILTVILASSLLFVVQEFCNIGLTHKLLSVGSSVFERGHIHRLFLYPFHHKTGSQLLLSSIAFVFLSGSLERGFGTVRFLIMFFLLSATSGFVYAIVDLLQGDSNHTEGLLPTALSCMAVTTMHTRMTKGFLCGVSFPTLALPWVFLILTTIVIPNAILPCNIIAVLTGWMYGKGWFSIVQMSESRASVLEKKIPFNCLKAVSHATFVPACTEDRRKLLLPQINPTTQGTYPVQAYVPASSLGPHQPVPYDGWKNSNSTLANVQVPLHPFEQSHGHSHGHHSHGHHSHSCNKNHNLSNVSSS